MEEDTESSGLSRRGLSPPIVANQVNSISVGKSNHDTQVKMDGATTALDESEPLLSVTRRIKEKREGT